MCVCGPPDSPNTLSSERNLQTINPYWSHAANGNDLQLSHHRLGINAGTSSANHAHMMVTAAILPKASNTAIAARVLATDQLHNIYLYKQ